MSPPRFRKKNVLASHAWQLMFDMMMASSSTRARSLAERGLTPNDARALWSLNTDERQPIGRLAQLWECDPSNATFIVGRLQRAGLARRTHSPEDRRVKLVELTAKGKRIKQELMAEYRIAPAELLQLDETDLQTLVDIFSKMTRTTAATRDAR